MRLKLYRWLFLVALLPACVNEDGADLAEPSTFLRYINGGNDDQARSILKTSDGYVILGNTEIPNAEGTGSNYKIKLVKTDFFGNVQWARVFPDFVADPIADTISYRANGIASLPNNGGYIIAGEDIQNEKSELFILVTDNEGSEPRKATISFGVNGTSWEVTGFAVTVNQDGNYLLLGNILNLAVDNMLLAEVNSTDLSLLWYKAYGSGEASLVNKLFFDANSKVTWGGTVKREDGINAIRLLRVEQNSEPTDFDLTLGSPDFDEEANDICRFGLGYAVIGSTNEKKETGSDQDILFKRLTVDGVELASQTFPLTNGSGTDLLQDETGNSIASTKDGGLILLSTIESSADIGRGGSDYYLIKINAFGTVEWTRSIGSKSDDEGVSVLQADDGGYIVLGTTRLANVETIALIKTDGEGNIQ